MRSLRQVGLMATLAIAALLLAACEPVPNVRPGEGSVSVPVPLPEGPPIVITDLPPEDRAPLGLTPTVSLPVEGDVLTSGQVLDRLRARLIQPACIVGPNNTRWRHKYAGYPRHFADQILATLPRMLVVLDQLEAHKLPAEFAVVPIVESWYRMDVRSFGGAVGMWQFLAQTARNNGATVSGDFDGRLSMLDSTQAAMSYLGGLQSMFNDWRLSAMAYNSGEFRLAKTMTPDELAARGAGSSVHYRRPWGLAFGTYEYVSKMRALICLLDQPARQGIPLDPTVPITHWIPYTVPAGIDSLDDLARRLGTDADALKDFNNGYRDGLIGPDAPRTLLVPAATRSRWAAVAASGATAANPSTPPATGPVPSASAPTVQTLLPPMTAPAPKPQPTPAAIAPAGSIVAKPNATPAAPLTGDVQTKPIATPPSAPHIVNPAPAVMSTPATQGAPAKASSPSPMLPSATAVTPAATTGTFQPPPKHASEPAAPVVKPVPTLPSSSSTPSTPTPTPSTPASATTPSSNPAAAATAAPATDITATPTSPSSPAHTPRTYKVELGDTLYSIAQSHGVKVDDLRAWNHLAADATLYVDQVIQLEP